MKPAFVLGIDGLPFTLTHRLMDDGVMPNFAALLERSGQLSQLEVTVPDFSCVSWTSFYTGVNPGKHGIYGFVDFEPDTGENYMPNGLHCQVPPLWHEVGAAGGRSVILNLPNTYPAQPLRGKMVAGFIAPEFDKACYPATFAQTLRSLGYKMDLDGVGGLGSPEHVRESISAVFKARKDAFRHVIKNEYWDLAVCVLTETDRLQHFYLHALSDSNHAMHAWTLNFYKELDTFIGEVVELLDGKADLYMVSDHGFDVVKQEILLEPLLSELDLASKQGYQHWGDPALAKETKVFTLDPGRFYINRKNSRFAHGFVEEAEVPEIIDKITQALLALCDDKTGEPIVSTVRTKQEGFHGDTLAYAPDIVAATHPGYYFKGFRHPAESKVRESIWEANHVWNDAIVYTPFKVTQNDQAKIWDVMPTVLHNMGIALPDYIDGKVLS